MDVDLVAGLCFLGQLLEGIHHIGVGRPFGFRLQRSIVADGGRKHGDVVLIQRQACCQEVAHFFDIAHAATQFRIVDAAGQAILEIVVDADEEGV